MKRSPPEPQCTVVYDGECVVCQSFYGWASRKDSRGQLSFAASQSASLATQAQAVDTRRARDALAFVRADGSVVYGARAMFMALGRLPGFWGVIGRTMAFPALSFVAEPFYRLFARHRHRFGWLLDR